MSERDIQKLISDHTALQNENTILKEQLSLMQEQFEWLKKQVFRRKTEQTSVIMGNDMQLSFFPVNNDKRSSADDNIITVPEHKRKKKRTHDDWMSELPVWSNVNKVDRKKKRS